MSSLNEFLHMGGYGAYVWTSYAAAAVILIVNVLWPMAGARRMRARLSRQRKLAERQT